MLVDSHCHLDLYNKNDLQFLIDTASLHDVQYMQTICTKLEDFPSVVKIAESYNNIFASVGIHPCDVQEIVDNNTLSKLALHPKVIGLGETGLDYYHTIDNKKLQVASFEQHILAAQDNQLPVIVHTREAEDDTYDIMTHMMNDKSFKALIHCFTASKDFARKVLDMNIYISISGIVTFKNASLLKEVVQFVPLDMMLIETDSPYLAPVPERGKQNQPAFVKYVAQAVADIKGISLHHVAEKTSKNFFTLFSKAKQIAI